MVPLLSVIFNIGAWLVRSIDPRLIQSKTDGTKHRK